MPTRRVFVLPILALLLAVSGTACASDTGKTSPGKPTRTRVVQESMPIPDGYPGSTAQPSASSAPVEAGDYVGTWRLTALGDNTRMATTSEIEAAIGTRVDSTIDLRADGTVTLALTIPSVDDSADGVWVLAGDGTATIDLYGKPTARAKLSQGQLKLKLSTDDGATILLYARS